MITMMMGMWIDRLVFLIIIIIVHRSYSKMAVLMIVMMMTKDEKSFKAKSVCWLELLNNNTRKKEQRRKTKKRCDAMISFGRRCLGGCHVLHGVSFVFRVLGGGGGDGSGWGGRKEEGNELYWLKKEQKIYTANDCK